MTLTAYDSASPQNIPEDAPAILCYADGMYAWKHELRPNAYWRYITVEGHPDADIADWEPGCIWDPRKLRKWAEERQHRSLDRTVYTDRDNFAAAAEALAGIPWHLGLATLDGSKPHSWQGKPCRFVQYTDRMNLYDMSIVYDVPWIETNKPS